MAEKNEDRKPILVVPFIGKKEYPRVEVFMDGTGATVKVTDRNGDKITNNGISYCSNKIDHILPLVSRIILTHKLTRHLPDTYNSTVEELMAIVKEHNRFMENLAKEV